MTAIFFVVLTVLMALVIYLDATRYLIPNWLVGMVLAFYPVMVFLSPVPVDWLTALLTMAATFALGFVIFAMRWMGGGDIKLLTATALWCGYPMVLTLLVLMALLGGVLVIALWVSRRILGMIPSLAGRTMPRMLQNGAPAPYGLAIAAAFLYLLWKGLLPGLML